MKNLFTSTIVAQWYERVILSQTANTTGDHNTLECRTLLILLALLFQGCMDNAIHWTNFIHLVHNTVHFVDIFPPIVIYQLKQHLCPPFKQLGPGFHGNITERRISLLWLSFLCLGKRRMQCNAKQGQETGRSEPESSFYYSSTSGS